MAPIAPHFIQMTTVRPLYVRWRDHNTSVIWPDLLGHDNCERFKSHKTLPSDLMKIMEVFLKACRVAHKKVLESKDRK